MKFSRKYDLSDDMGISGSYEFIFAEKERKIKTEARIGKGFPPPINEYEPTEDEKDWIGQPLTHQVKQTAIILAEKKMRYEDQVFYVIGSNVDPAGPSVEQVLHKLKAEVISFFDDEHSKILIDASNAALNKITEKEIPQYLEKYLKMIRPLSINEQIPLDLREDWRNKSKMVIINIMPNLEKARLTEYVNQTKISK
ncbi:MAG: hypothetical protein ACREAE_04450 [Nitrosopumilaceae archaeon]